MEGRGGGGGGAHRGNTKYLQRRQLLSLTLPASTTKEQHVRKQLQPVDAGYPTLSLKYSEANPG